MHPVLDGFLNKWVYPTGFSGPGYEFRMRETERMVPIWERTVQVSLKDAERKAQLPDDDWKKAGALGGYSGEGPHMSIKQMATQLHTISMPLQKKYIDLQRLHARQIMDEVRHGMLHCDVLLRGGWIDKEEDLRSNPRAAAQSGLAYFGLTSMFPHVHPLARAAQHYFFEGVACLGIASSLYVHEDPLVRHENFSQRDEELMHFLKGKYFMDAYALAPEDQAPIKEVLDFLLAPFASTAERIRASDQGQPGGAI